MKKDLQDKLFNKYPKIFRQKDLSCDSTCMCWGIDTDDGWYWLLDNLCSQLQWDIDRNGQPQIEAIQVKEKFGTLRFYTNGGTDQQYGMISLAEFMSGSICEKCGSTKNVTQTKSGWIVTLCEDCMKNYYRKEHKKYTSISQLVWDISGLKFKLYYFYKKLVGGVR